MLKNMKFAILSFIALAIMGNTICSEEASDEQMGRELIRAAENGDDQQVKEILDSRPHLVDYYKGCTTPLCQAAFYGQQNVVEALLRRGAQIDKTTGLGNSSLTIAARKGKTAIVRILLQHGAYIEHRGIMDRTALSETACRGHFDTCVALLQHGAEIEAKDDNDETPLFQAAILGHTKVAELLLKHGANVNVTDRFFNHTSLAHLFHENAFRLYGVPAEKKLAIIKLLISYGAKITDEIANKILAEFPDYAPRIEAALLFERQRRALLEHTEIPVEVTNLIFSFQECYENQKCCQCSDTIRQLSTPELIRVCDTSPLHRICTDCDQKRQECNDHTCPVCSNCAQQ